MATEPIRGHYVDQEWAGGQQAEGWIRAWQRGQTGFPLVDAGRGWAGGRAEGGKGDRARAPKAVWEAKAVLLEN